MKPVFDHKFLCRQCKKSSLGWGVGGGQVLAGGRPDLWGRQLRLVVKLPLDVELDLLAGGQALHLDQDLVEVVRIKLERHRRHHLDVQVLVLDPAEDVVDQLMEDGL